MCRNSVRWLYRLERAYTWRGGPPIQSEQLFFDRKGRLRLVMRTDGTITITAGYSWNGCSPKFCLFDLVLGTPDGVVHARTGRPKTYFASMIHDALYQFLPAGLPLSRREADRIFLRLMEESEFGPRRIYWLAVRALGWFMRPAIAKSRGHRGTRELAENFVAEESEE
jgi:hypothetical protein